MGHRPTHPPRQFRNVQKFPDLVPFKFFRFLLDDDDDDSRRLFSDSLETTHSTVLGFVWGLVWTGVTGGFTHSEGERTLGLTEHSYSSDHRSWSLRLLPPLVPFRLRVGLLPSTRFVEGGRLKEKGVHLLNVTSFSKTRQDQSVKKFC